jgi:hypothetical protein
MVTFKESIFLFVDPEMTNGFVLPKLLIKMLPKILMHMNPRRRGAIEDFVDTFVWWYVRLCRRRFGKESTRKME